MDGAFNRSPVGFTQLLTLHSFNEETNTTLPVVFIILTYKTESIYRTALLGLKSIIEDNNIRFFLIQTDFEYHLSKSFKWVFGEKIKALGCYFHYIKCM